MYKYYSAIQYEIIQLLWDGFEYHPVDVCSSRAEFPQLVCLFLPGPRKKEKTFYSVPRKPLCLTDPDHGFLFCTIKVITVYCLDLQIWIGSQSS